MPPSSRHAPIPVEVEERSRRSTRESVKPRNYAEHDQADAHAEEGADDEAQRKTRSQAPRNTRNGSRRKSGGSQRYREASDFEDKIAIDSPPVRSRSSRRSTLGKKQYKDPDSADEDGEGEVDGEGEDEGEEVLVVQRARSQVLAFPSRPTPIHDPESTHRSNGRRGAREQSRNASADGESDFAPTASASSQSPEAEDHEETYNEDREDDFVVYTDDSRAQPTRRSKRTLSRATSAATRKSARVAAKMDESDEDFGGTGGSRRRSRRGDDFIPITKRLRQRNSKPDYTLPPLDLEKEMKESAIAAVSRPGGRVVFPGNGYAGGQRFGAGMPGGASRGLPWTTKGKELGRALGDDSSDSVSLSALQATRNERQLDQDDLLAAHKNAAAGPSNLGNARNVNGGPPATTDVPNFGRVNPKSSMADADPLGVDMNVTFDNVGGLDGHINQLKEMVALPLLYPELFQQFGVTPPRGVLFHGPPGTGKTLLARALAASCSTGNTKIAFFMRKGADVLSKWVGEAERQLRMLFEEARASQPSIIFFDEIDGLAPVRSSKQDQIHASLVSTLLALMDGMDGRGTSPILHGLLTPPLTSALGQVIVIGATNRPDAVDPALRRPGRFDREFYFPLPNKDARKKIISINTRMWEPKLTNEMLDKLGGLTKGYGGADLRALCTEAALNAIQRRYPQIYKSADRLMLETKSIHVQAKDFMISVKKIVPSSARSTASAAIPLPTQLVPILSKPLERLKSAVDRVLPPAKTRTALEEAEFEEEDGDSFEKEMMLQSLSRLRTYRPRILVYGEQGMGQSYIGPAVLHHLEGFHVQSFDLATLMSDSARTPESALVQLFVEAKRHQPSILYIPSLTQWAYTLSETARSTVRALLDGIPPSDPILLLAIVDGPITDLPKDVRNWFGFSQENRIELSSPSIDDRVDFFAELLKTIQRPPTDFPDGIPRKRRILEGLSKAPPLPEPKRSEADLAKDAEKDIQVRDYLYYSFVSLLQEFRKTFKRVTTSIKVDALELNEREIEAASIPAIPASPILGSSTEDVEAVVPAVAAPRPWRAHNVDIDTMSRRLFRHKYLTPADFLEDIRKIEENSERIGDPDRQLKVSEMAVHARMHVQSFDAKWMGEFDRYAERMKARKLEREKDKGKLANGEGGGTLKRGREEDEDEGEEVRVEKRPRAAREEEGMDLDTAAVAVPQSDDTGSGSLSMAVPPAPCAPVPSPSTLLSSPEPVSSIPPTLTIPSPQLPQHASQPATPTPPFIIPIEEMEELTSALKHDTGRLNVEQLEQLRAMLLDRIWRKRGDWDRTSLLVDLVGVVERFKGEVEMGLDDEAEE
ncbi:ATPase family AAA domain-containing protein 2, partial [Tremellales sp. Uapishka_1]